MQFWAFAIATQPDVETARRLHGLDDLDDAGVVKVMQHHARQRHYTAGSLAPEQQRIASLTLAYASEYGIRLDTLGLADATEVQMLEALCEAAAMEKPMLYWDAAGQVLRVLDHRMFQLGIDCPAYWSVQQGQDRRLVDIGARLHGDSATWQDLDERARAIGLPGLIGFGDGSVLQPLGEKTAGATDLTPYSEIPALNLLLIGARWCLVNGDLTLPGVARLQSDLRTLLAADMQAHRTAFLERWGQ